MNANDILSDQVIYVKRGRSNGLGFEPAFNSYFDFYLSSKYFGEPLLELEDVTLHLYLRKNLNDTNKNWKMPTIRQMMTKFGISQKKLMTILKRLEQAHLLFKESGVKGGMTVRNDYVLSDPIPSLNEFLGVAAENLFRLPLLPGYMPAQPDGDTTQETCITEQYTDTTEQYTSVSLGDTPRVSPSDTDQQTSSFQQTLKKQTINPLWEKALEELKLSLPAKTFENFLENTDLVSIQEGVAVISTLNAYAKDWIENRMANKIKYALNVEGVKCVVLTE